MTPEPTTARTNTELTNTEPTNGELTDTARTNTEPGLPPLYRDRAVHIWVGASGVSFAGDSVFLIGFAWAAVHEASPALAGLLVGVGMIPQALLLLFGGALADRFDTRWIVLSATWSGSSSSSRVRRPGCQGRRGSP